MAHAEAVSSGQAVRLLAEAAQSDPSLSTPSPTFAAPSTSGCVAVDLRSLDELGDRELYGV